MVAAIAIDTAAGRILDEGPDVREDDDAFERASYSPMSAQGIVKQAIHGPRGETRGAVLEDGRIIRLPPHEAKRFSDLLKKGARISVNGDGATTSFGTVIEAREIGASTETIKPVEAGKPKHGSDRKAPKHGRKKHGSNHRPEH